MQVVVSGSVDVGLSAGVLGTLGAYAKGAPVRVIAASSTGSRKCSGGSPPNRRCGRCAR